MNVGSPSLTRRGLLAAGLGSLAACSGKSIAYHDNAGVAARSWHLSQVHVTVPPDLVVSDEDIVLPKADIVWHWDPPGDRRAQAGQVIETAIRKGAGGLHGPVPVRFEVQLERFHILTPAAYQQAPRGFGVSSVNFTLTVYDQRSGAVLRQAERMVADTPALNAREEQGLDPAGVATRGKARLIAQLAAVMAGWLGTGPDLRGPVQRFGG